MSNEALRLLLASAVLLTGCTASQSTPKPSVGGQIGEVPADMQSDYESFAVNCSKCHDIDRALAAPVTDHEHWDIYVAKMMRTAGSAIHKDEAPHILRFLYWYTDHKAGRSIDGKSKAVAPAPKPVPVTAPASAPVKQEVIVPVTPPPAAPPPANVGSETQGEGAP
jgi:cytochrome c5